MKEKPCASKKCQNKCNYLLKIFYFFNNMPGRPDQMQFLSECIKSVPVKRKRTSNKTFKKSCTNGCYLLKIEEKFPTKVCQQFILNKFTISQRLLRIVIENKNMDKFPVSDKRE